MSVGKSLPSVRESASNIPLGQQLHAVETGVPGQPGRVSIFLNHIARILDGFDVVCVSL
jgi:hypothetical protein